MTETSEDLHPLGGGGRFDPVAAAKLAAKVIAVIVPALLGAFGAYHKAASDAAVDTKARVQISKDKAEAGYQFTAHALEALERRVLGLEQAAHRQELARKVPTRPGRRPPPAPPAPPAAATVLPPNLDQAQRQIAKPAPPVPPPPADAGQVGR